MIRYATRSSSDKHDKQLTSPSQARGKEALRGPAYHQRLLPAYTTLKFRQPGQGGAADKSTRDLRAELEAAEAAHYAKLKGAPIPGTSSSSENNTPAIAGSSASSVTGKRPLPSSSNGGGDRPPDDGDEDPEAKRRRILAETRDIDADDDSSSGSDKDSDSESGSADSDDSSDDEEAELQRELERVRRERMEKRAREEAERKAAEEARREEEIARGNPLLNKPDFTVKRRWDEDVVFKNQARGTEDKGKRKEFVNVSPPYRKSP